MHAQLLQVIDELPVTELVANVPTSLRLLDQPSAPQVRQLLRYSGLSLSESRDLVAYVLLAPAQHPHNLQPHRVSQALEYL